MTGNLRVAIGAGGTGGHIYPGSPWPKRSKQVTDGASRSASSAPRGAADDARPECRLRAVHVRHGRAARPEERAADDRRSSSAPASGRIPADQGAQASTSSSAWAATRRRRRWSGARLARIPSLIHESNAMPGRANAFIARLTPNIAIAFERTRQHLPKRADVRTVGMPLMPEVARWTGPRCAARPAGPSGWRRAEARRGQRGQPRRAQPDDDRPRPRRPVEGPRRRRAADQDRAGHARGGRRPAAGNRVGPPRGLHRSHGQRLRGQPT